MRFGKNAQRSDGNMNPFERYKKKRNAVILRNIKRKVNQEKKEPSKENLHDRNDYSQSIMDNALA